MKEDALWSFCLGVWVWPPRCRKSRASLGKACEELRGPGESALLWVSAAHPSGAVKFPRSVTCWFLLQKKSSLPYSFMCSTWSSQGRIKTERAYAMHLGKGYTHTLAWEVSKEDLGVKREEEIIRLVIALLGVVGHTRKRTWLSYYVSWGYLTVAATHACSISASLCPYKMANYIMIKLLKYL